MNRLLYIIIGVVLFILIINLVRKGKISIAESFFWVVGAFCILILAIFPHIIDIVSKLVGVNDAPALFLLFCIIYLVLIVFRHSRQIAEQNIKICELGQNIALLKEKNK
ncbi:MAG: DUF2304 domain-containing protein [Bacilli bacterium]